MCAELLIGQLADKKITIGHWARNLRVYLELKPKELARKANVTLEEVILFEQNRPVSIDIKNRILKALYAIRLKNWDKFLDR
ncbi:hypothetical protein ACFLWN_03840 [Chloroflexota bacterium]